MVKVVRAMFGSSRPLVVWIVGTLLLAAGALAVFFLTMPQCGTVAAVAAVDLDGDLTMGPKNARVVVLEYADFECGPCASYETFVKPLREEYKDRVLIVFRFFP